MKLSFVLAFIVTCLLSQLSSANEHVAGTAYRGELPINKVIFGEFPREQVTSSVDFLERTVGQIEARYGDISYICSATLIDSNHIITAAHCVYDVEKSIWANSLMFYPGRLSGNNNPHGSVKGTKFYLNKMFTTLGDTYISENIPVDYAVVELAEPIGNKLGWVGLEAVSSDINTFDIQFLGYPGDKDYGTLWGVKCPGTIESNRNMIDFKCDIYGGMSGSSLRSKRRNDTVFGVLTSDNGIINNGNVFSKDILNEILDWVKENKVTSNTLTHVNDFPVLQDYEKIRFFNDTNVPVQVIIKYLSVENVWETKSWSFDPHENAYLFNTRNTIYYLYAISNDKKAVWSGNKNMQFNGTTYPMKEIDLTIDNWGTNTHSITF